MSAFLDFPNEVVSMGLSTLDVHNKWKTNLTNTGWQVKGEQTAVKPYTLDVFPPASEVIGNVDAYEFLRISTNDTTVEWQPLKHWNRAFPQMVRIFTPTAGAILVTATLAGVAVTYQGLAGATVEDNLMGLFYAIKASANAAWTAYSWELSFPAPQNADDPVIYIIGTKNVYSAADIISGVNCTTDVLGIPVAPGYDQQQVVAQAGVSLTIDLTNGFIYYMQICARGIALAIRTNGGYFGSLHACYSDHEKALAAMPKNSPYCSPIELVVGTDDDATNVDSSFRVASYWGMGTVCKTVLLTQTGRWGGPVTGRALRDVFQDVLGSTSTMTSYGVGTSIPIYGSNMFTDDDRAGNDFQVHRVSRSSYVSGGANTTTEMFFVVPPIVIEDWYKFRGTAVDENLITVADTIKVATVTADFNTVSATIPVDDLSVFQPSGSIVIGKEWITYTGKSATSGPGSLTGCVHGTWATTARKHYAGEKVSQGLWFVKINGSAIFAGYSKPLA